MKFLKTTALILMAVTLISLSAQAQTEEEKEKKEEETEEEKAKFTFNGTFDAYFRSNLNASNDPKGGTTLAPSTAFANSPGFALGMVNVVGGYEKGKVGVVLDLVVGPRGQQAVFLSNSNSNLINQAYVYYNASDRLKFTLGNFNTFLGYEVISPAGNFNYSTSYLFSYGPFSHAGIKVDYDLGGGFSVMGGFFNPTDATEFNLDGTFVGGAQIGYSKGSSSVYLNALFEEDYYQFDITAGTNLTEAIYLGLNASKAKDSFEGVAGYFQVSTNDNLALGMRAEYFKDDGVEALQKGQNVIDFTFTANYKIDQLTIIPEFRMDRLSYDGFNTDKDNPTKMGRDLSSIVIAAVYSF